MSVKCQLDRQMSIRLKHFNYIEKYKLSRKYRQISIILKNINYTENIDKCQS